MADARTTEAQVLYQQRSKLGMTTFHYRSKCYSFPSVIVKSDLSEPSAHHTCIMLDVGQSCPFCAGRSRARLVHKRSQVTVSPYSSQRSDKKGTPYLHKPDLSAIQHLPDRSHISSQSTTKPNLPAFTCADQEREAEDLSRHTLPFRKPTHAQTQLQYCQDSLKSNTPTHVSTIDVPSHVSWDNLTESLVHDEVSDITSDAENLRDVDTPSLQEMERKILNDLSGLRTSSVNPPRHCQPPRGLTRTGSDTDGSIQLLPDASYLTSKTKKHKSNQPSRGSKGSPSESQEPSKEVRKASLRSESPEELLEEILDSIADEVEVYSGDATLGKAFCLTATKRNKLKDKKGTSRAAMDSEVGEFYDFMQGLHNMSSGSTAEQHRPHTSSAAEEGLSSQTVNELLVLGPDIEVGMHTQLAPPIQPRSTSLDTTATMHSVTSLDTDSVPSTMSMDTSVQRSLTTANTSFTDDSVFTSFRNTSEEIFEHEFEGIVEGELTSGSKLDWTSDYESEVHGHSGRGRVQQDDFLDIDLIQRYLSESSKQTSASTEVLLDETSERSCSSMLSSHLAPPQVTVDFRMGSTSPGVASSRISECSSVLSTDKQTDADLTDGGINFNLPDVGLTLTEDNQELGQDGKNCQTLNIPEPFAMRTMDTSRLQAPSCHDECEATSEGSGVSVEDFLPETEEYSVPPEIMQDAFQAAVQVSEIFKTNQVCLPCGHVALDSIAGSNEDIIRDDGPITEEDFQANSAVTLAELESDEKLNNQQVKQFFTHMFQSGKTTHSPGINKDLQTCLDKKCSTCDETVDRTETQRVKDEEITTEEVTLVFAWPKKDLVCHRQTPATPYRDLHMRRVIRATDCKYTIIEGPFLQSNLRPQQALPTNITNKAETAGNYTAVSSKANAPSLPIKATIDVKVTSARYSRSNELLDQGVEESTARLTKNVLTKLISPAIKPRTSTAVALPEVQPPRIRLTAAAQVYVDSMVDILVTDCISKWPEIENNSRGNENEVQPLRYRTREGKLQDALISGERDDMTGPEEAPDDGVGSGAGPYCVENRAQDPHLVHERFEPVPVKTIPCHKVPKETHARKSARVVACTELWEANKIPSDTDLPSLKPSNHHGRPLQDVQNECRMYSSLQELPSTRPKARSKLLSLSDTLLQNMENQVRSASSEDDMMQVITSCASEIESRYRKSGHQPLEHKTTRRMNRKQQVVGQLHPIHEGILPNTVEARAVPAPKKTWPKSRGLASAIVVNTVSGVAEKPQTAPSAELKASVCQQPEGTYRNLTNSQPAATEACNASAGDSCPSAQHVCIKDTSREELADTNANSAFTVVLHVSDNKDVREVRDRVSDLSSKNLVLGKPPRPDTSHKDSSKLKGDSARELVTPNRPQILVSSTRAEGLASSSSDERLVSSTRPEGLVSSTRAERLVSSTRDKGQIIEPDSRVGETTTPQAGEAAAPGLPWYIPFLGSFDSTSANMYIPPATVASLKSTEPVETDKDRGDVKDVEEDTFASAVENGVLLGRETSDMAVMDNAGVGVMAGNSSGFTWSDEDEVPYPFEQSPQPDIVDSARHSVEQIFKEEDKLVASTSQQVHTYSELLAQVILTDAVVDYIERLTQDETTSHYHQRSLSDKSERKCVNKTALPRQDSVDMSEGDPYLQMADDTEQGLTSQSLSSATFSESGSFSLCYDVSREGRVMSRSCGQLRRSPDYYSLSSGNTDVKEYFCSDPEMRSKTINAKSDVSSFKTQSSGGFRSLKNEVVTKTLPEKVKFSNIIVHQTSPSTEKSSPHPNVEDGRHKDAYACDVDGVPGKVTSENPATNKRSEFATPPEPEVFVESALALQDRKLFESAPEDVMDPRNSGYIRSVIIDQECLQGIPVAASPSVATASTAVHTQDSAAWGIAHRSTDERDIYINLHVTPRLEDETGLFMHVTDRGEEPEKPETRCMSTDSEVEVYQYTTYLPDSVVDVSLSEVESDVTEGQQILPNSEAEDESEAATSPSVIDTSTDALSALSSPCTPVCKKPLSFKEPDFSADGQDLETGSEDNGENITPQGSSVIQRPKTLRTTVSESAQPSHVTDKDSHARTLNLSSFSPTGSSAFSVRDDDYAKQSCLFLQKKAKFLAALFDDSPSTLERPTTDDDFNLLCQKVTHARELLRNKQDRKRRASIDLSTIPQLLEGDSAWSQDPLRPSLTRSQSIDVKIELLPEVSKPTSHVREAPESDTSPSELKDCRAAHGSDLFTTQLQHLEDTTSSHYRREHKDLSSSEFSHPMAASEASGVETSDLQVPQGGGSALAISRAEHIVPHAPPGLGTRRVWTERPPGTRRTPEPRGGFMSRVIWNSSLSRRHSTGDLYSPLPPRAPHTKQQRYWRSRYPSAISISTHAHNNACKPPIPPPPYRRK